VASSDTTRSQAVVRLHPVSGLWVSVIAASLALLLVAGVTLAFQLAYADRVYPGVTVGGVPVGGQTGDEATALIQQKMSVFAQTRITLRQANQSWTPTAAELGLRYDATGSAAAALAVGRYGNLFQRLSDQVSSILYGHDVAPFLSFDQPGSAAQIASYADAIRRNPANSALEFKPDGAVGVTAARAGLALDVDGSVALARANLLVLSAEEITLATKPVPVPLSDAELEKARAYTDNLVSKPLTLTGEDRSWTIPSRDLVSLLIVVDKGDALDIKIDDTKLTTMVEGMARDFARAPVDASVRLEGSRAVVVAGQNGRRLDVAASVKAIREKASSQRTIGLVGEPVLGLQASDLEPLQAQLTALLKAPAVFRYADKTWTMPAAELAAAITFTKAKAGSAPGIELNGERMAPMIAAIAKDLDRKPRDAQLRFKEGKAAVIVDSIDGITVDAAGTVTTATAALAVPGTPFPVQVTLTKPALSNADAAKLKFDDLISDSSTSFAGAISQKAHNVKLAASRLDGTMVAPGAEFSFNDALGPATLASGFQNGYGIYLDNKGQMQTVQSEAGGICQVATTLFQSVFWAGYQIVERNTHMYWIAKYGAPPRGLRGLDATVDDGFKVDFRFKNNSKDWIGIQAATEATTLRFVLWGVKPTWTVKVGQPQVSNWVAANRGLVKEPDPTMPVGWSLYVEAPEDGFEVSIDRTVTDGDATVDKWTAKARYRPSRNVMLVGTKGVDLTKTPFALFVNTATPGTGTPGTGTPQATPGPGTPQPTPDKTPAPAATATPPPATKAPQTATPAPPTKAPPAATPVPPTKAPGR
jgi:vancomycin resistance protein YoaR